MATFSNDVKITNFQLKSTQPLYSNTSWTGQRIMRSTGIQFYELQFQLNFTKQAWPEVQNFLAKYSQGGAFTIPMGFLGTYYGEQSGSLTSTSVVPAGSRVVTTNTNKMAVGENVRFNNHSKIYQITDRTDNSITVLPALQRQVQASEIIQYNNLDITATLDPDNDYSVVSGNLMSITLKAREVI
ncbi:MAG: hypothetical protein K0S95_754 [Pantoea eucrina]|jgi:hypothetical protein|nr:hypothetical protein [Pantoea eucrina]